MAAKKSRKRAATADTAQIPNQIFLGLPWRTVRPKYETIVKKVRKTFPLTFIIVGREENQDAEDLLEVIKKRILTSSYAIFDATGGNANVSLEFGFAEASNVPRAIYLSTHQAARRATRESPIIADLVGKAQNRYTQANGLERLLRQFCKNHPYTKRFEGFFSASFRRKKKGEKKRLRTLAVKLVGQLRDEGTARRTDIVQNLQADASRYARDEIDDMIQRMHNEGLIRSLQGPYSTVTVT